MKSFWLKYKLWILGISSSFLLFSIIFFISKAKKDAKKGKYSAKEVINMEQTEQKTLPNSTIVVERHTFGDTYTIGKMYINGTYVCDTLEDVIREVKIKHKTAIPYGTYPVKNTYSPHFKKVLPELFDVPNFSAIRIHAGNTEADTSGCILVGTYDGDRAIKSSRIALDKVLNLLRTDEKMTISIIQ